jgi:signal transduction histidine kinase
MSAPRVLIVDDDPALLEALPQALRLRMEDLQVDTSDSAQMALEQVAETDYDALVVDIKMPGMDGLELLEEIKKLQPDTPTIMITGHGDHDLAVQALRGGAHDYVTKPIDREYFVSSLSRAVECHRLGQEVAAKRSELLRHTEELEACVQERTLELREALHREQSARREVDEVNRRLEEVSRQRDLFVSMVAHDLATPLTTIRGYAELLGRSNAAPDRQERARSIIISETRRLARLAADLADASQLVTGRFQIQRGPCDMSEIVREQVELARSRSSRHVIHAEVPPRVPLACDRDRLGQVLSNLLSNAITYAPDGEIRVHLELQDGQALLRVSDQGPGIPPDVAETIFDPGWRLADDGDDSHPTGRGFGLHITRGIVEAHGGRIWVDPDAENGATLVVALPLAPSEVRTTSAAPAGEQR